MYYPLELHDNNPPFDKIQITFLSSHILIIPLITNYYYHNDNDSGYYYINALFKEKGSYRMLIRLECGHINYMNIPYTTLKNITYILESRNFINNNTFIIDINDDDEYNYDNTTTIEEEENRYCTSTEAFHGRFSFNNINFLDKHIHNGDIYSLFKPYNCKLNENIKNTSYLLNVLTNQHMIFLGDSTMGMVFKGIVERIMGVGTYNKDNNSKQWRIDNMKYNNKYENRLFDIDRFNIRLSFMFNGGPIISNNFIGAIADDFTININWEYYRTQLRKIIHTSINQCRDITIFLNSGLHDIHSNSVNITEHNLFSRNLKHAINYLHDLINEEKNNNNHYHECNNSMLETQYFWVKIVPTFGAKICAGGYVRYLNNIADKVMNRLGIKILDVYSMLTGFPQDSDGAHCLKDYILPSTPYNSYSCHRLVDSYLHAILSKNIS